MGNWKTTKEILNKRINVNNDNNKYLNNVNNDNATDKDKYSLKRDVFTPNTREAILAEEIATRFDDLSNYAAFLRVVKELGYEAAMNFYHLILGEIEEKKDTDYCIRSPKKYFMWKFKRKLYK